MDNMNCPRCGRRGHIIGQPNAFYGGGVPMRCYDHGEFSWLADSKDAYEDAASLAASSSAYAARLADAEDSMRNGGRE